MIVASLEVCNCNFRFGYTVISGKYSAHGPSILLLLNSLSCFSNDSYNLSRIQLQTCKLNEKFVDLHLTNCWNRSVLQFAQLNLTLALSLMALAVSNATVKEISAGYYVSFNV